MGKDPRYSAIPATVNEGNVVESTERILKMLYGTDRRTESDPSLDGTDNVRLEDSISKLANQVRKLETETSKSDVDSCKIIAMTLSKFIMSFGPESGDGRRFLNVDRVFLDEAGYCNCIQALSLFTLGVPVTMLGDHMQLPPVCEVKEETIVSNMDTPRTQV